MKHTHGFTGQFAQRDVPRALPAALLAALLLGGCTTPGAVGSAPGPTPAVLHGAQSAIAEPELHVIGDEATWAALWKRHASAGPAREDTQKLRVDFARGIVVAVFEGATVSSRGVDLVSANVEGDTLVVHYTDLHYQTTSYGPHVTPYGFFVLPRAGREVLLIEDIVSMSGSRRFEERARVPMPPG